MSPITQGLDRVEAVFDDGSLVADAGLLLAFAPVAPSTLGSFMRSFTWGHVRQFDRVQELASARAWEADAAAAEHITVDVDSTVREVHSDAKQGAAYGHTGVLGYHPLVAVRDDTGEIVHSPMRKGSSQRGHVRFAAETLARVRRLAPQAELTLRADAGFFSWDLIDKLAALDARFFVAAARNPAVDRAIAAISEADWTPIGYTDDIGAVIAMMDLVWKGCRRHGDPSQPRVAHL